MDYESVYLQDSIEIQELVSLHYFQYHKDFAFPGEAHPFWEFVCVDSGEITAIAGEKEIPLKKGEILFHEPNEFHNVLTNGKSAPSLVVISFYCHSPALWHFRRKCLSVTEQEKRILSKIIQEGSNVFSGRMDQPYQKKLLFSSEQNFGGQQLIRQYLAEFLISLYRRYFSLPLPGRSTEYFVEKGNRKRELYNSVVEYLERRLQDKLTIEEICRDMLLGHSHLQKLFQEVGSMGVMELFHKMKVDTAKRMIREGQLNFTQIADQLGYSSIHYFSRQFKKECDMSPSEYAQSIRSLAEEA